MRPRILLVAVSDWFGASRLPRMLKRAGFEVGLLADPNTLIAQSRHIDYRFDLDVVTLRLGVIGPALQAIMGFNPRTIIPCDEAAAHLLQNFALSWDGARGPGGQLRVAMPPLVRELLLRALGEARTFNVRVSRNLSRRLAVQLGLAVPPSIPVPYLQVAEGFARENGWPVALTREGVSEGASVRVCNSREELHAAYSALTHVDEPPGGFRQKMRYAYWTAVTSFHLAGDLTVSPIEGPMLSIEAVVPGQPATYTTAAYDGRWLGGFSAVAVRTHPQGTGAASAVRLIDDPAMTDAGRRMIGRLGYGGFAGLDFRRDPATGKLWFLRFTPRPTPFVHLGHLATGDLGEALMAAMGNLPAAAPKVFEETTVALFPQDWMRDPESSARGTDYEDMPEEDERLLASLRLRIPRRGAVSP